MTASDSMAAGTLGSAPSPALDASGASSFQPPATPAASKPVLTLDLGALAANWRALDALSGKAEAAAVVKADAYGLGVAPAAKALAAAGAKTFFVAHATEGAELREALGPGVPIHVFNGFMPDDLDAFRGADLIPVLNSPFQIEAFRAALPQLSPSAAPKVGLHIESGINRLGFTPAEIDALRADPPRDLDVSLVMSHLACADEPEHSMNARQRGAFTGRAQLLHGLAPNARLSLGATGGVLLGPEFHFDLTRPGVGLYGGEPFMDARTVVHLHAPLLQVREIAAGETVGYGGTWTARRPSRIGVLGLGYADGFFRLSKGLNLYVDGRAVPLIGRVSMDMITVDLTDLPEPAPGAMVEVLGPNQSVDALAKGIGTTGYEVLTSLGPRYARRYVGGAEA
ncbi:alanine racemase [Albimonas sp. CAU 1670]|uniref:alanine racemase n=1 Tax=Albimonas sp. CAU 1670 TaxID=3032599 RepID=UPI0023DAA2D5|nr:alanine racemase [Albimonas sp. CAU 1670]MDF2232005.1 alanine racemase [Albimonas sp. CAU 1670]